MITRLYVEGPSDKEIFQAILSLLGLQKMCHVGTGSRKIQGKDALMKHMKTIVDTATKYQKFIFVLDKDAQNDVRKKAQHEVLEMRNVYVFFIPGLERWTKMILKPDKLEGYENQKSKRLKSYFASKHIHKQKMKETPRVPDIVTIIMCGDIPSARFPDAFF